MKVYKVTVCVVDHDKLGPDGVKEGMECARYSNHCMQPRVMDVETREIEWSDDHPLNIYATEAEEFKRLFSG